MKELVGLAALLSAAIEILKRLGLIPDGYGGLAVVIANTIVFLVAGIAGFYGWDVSSWDKVFMTIAELLLMFLSSFVTHKVAREMELPLFRKV